MKTGQKAKSYKLALKVAVPLLVLALFFLGCGVLPPVILGISLSSNRVLVNESVRISAEATSSSGLPLSYSWSATGGTISPRSGYAVMWTAPDTPGLYSISLVVSDGTNSISDGFDIYARHPDAPEIQGVSFDTPIATASEVEFTCNVDNPEGLTYRWGAENIAADNFTSQIGQKVKWVAPPAAGVYRLNVTATDSFGLQDYFEFNARVVTPSAPTVVVSPASATVSAGGILTFNATASDPEGFLPLTYAWSATGGTFANPSDASTSWTAPDSGPVTIYVTVTNSANLSTTSDNVIVTIN
jgi:hypothetical protein